jgi:hypothetical protein
MPGWATCRRRRDRLPAVGSPVPCRPS